MPESAVVRFERIELVQPVEEGLFGDREEGLEIFLCTFGGCYALVAVVVTFLGRVSVGGSFRCLVGLVAFGLT